MKYFSERRTDKNQQRKHVSQMTIHEKRRCARMLKDSLMVYGEFGITNHAKSKVSDKIPFGMLKAMILNGSIAENIIEYNVKYMDKEDMIDERVVVRVSCTYTNDICLSVSIISGKIVTVYYNKKYDNHDTIDLSYYNGKLLIK